MKFKIEFEVDYDEKTKSLKVKNNPIVTRAMDWSSDSIISTIGRITESTFDYGLITFSRGTLPLSQGDEIFVKYYDTVVPVTISSVPGRISSLSKIVRSKSFITEFKPNDELNIFYDTNSNLLELKKKIQE